MPDPTTKQPTAPDPAAVKAWQEQIAALPEDIRGHASLKDIKDLAGLAKAFVDTKSMVGADKLVIPAKDAPKEQWDAYWTKLGRPESPDKYELAQEGLPQGIDVPPEMLTAYFGKAHELGMSKQQVAGIHRWMLEHLKATETALGESAATEASEAVAALKKEFGSAYEQRLNLARNAVQEFGGDELKGFLEETGLGNDPRLVKAFAKIGQAIGSDEILGLGGRANFGTSPDEAQRKIAEKMRDPAFQKAYMEEYSPGHMEAVAEMHALFKAAYPEPEPANA